MAPGSLILLVGIFWEIHRDVMRRALPSLRVFAAAAASVLAGSAADRAPAKEPLLKKVGEHHLLTGRQGTAAVALGDYVYIVGGGSFGAVADIERLNVGTGKIEQINDQLLPRRYHRAIEYENRIYIFGGQAPGTATQPMEDAVEIYDPSTNKITRGAKMPHPRSHLAVARMGAYVVTAGGTEFDHDRTKHTGRVEIYDLKRDRWNAGPAMPTAREGQAAVVGAFLIIAGGFRAPQAVPTVEMFVPQENAWKALPPLARKVSAHSAAVLDKYLFLFGDYDRLDSVLAYNLSTRETTDVATDFEGFRHTAAAVHRGKIYIIGGNRDSGSAATDLIQVFALNAPAEKPAGNAKASSR